MNARRNSGPVYVDAYGGIAAVFSGDMDRYRAKDKNMEAPVRYKRGKRRKSITVTRKETMPAIRSQSPAPLPPRPRPMKRSDSSISRVSVASEFATIAEDAVCDDFRGEVRQSYPPTAGRRVSFSSASETPPALYNRRSSSSSLVGKSSYDEPPRRRVSIVSLQRSDSTVSSLMDFNPRRLSTVSDAVVIRKTPKPWRRNSADGYVGHIRRASADGNTSMSGRRSFPPQSTSRRYHQASGPAYQSYPPPDMGEKSRDVFEGSMADRDGLSYEATLRRASLASIHEMHHAITLLKNQKALAKLQKAQGRNFQDGSTGGYGSRRSSLRGSSPRQSVGSGSSRARGNSTASLDAHLRRLSISTSIQDMHQQMTLIKEKQLVKRLNSRVQFSVVEDAARPSESRRGSLASGRRRSSAGGSPISAASMSSMTGGRSRLGSQDSDSYSSNSDYSSSSGSSSDYSGSSSEYSESDSEDSQSSSDDATSSDSDSDTSSDSGSEVSGSGLSSQEAHGSSDDDRSVASSAGTSSTDTDSGNGTLSSSHGSKTEGQPKGIQDLAGPSGLGRMGRVSPKSPPHTDTRENHFDFSGTHHPMVQKGAGDNGAQQKVMKGQATSKACVIL
ncbi:clumping factor A-like [Patiria miniata]|uniref:Uncharacterized protein n=1 Tax=Patiria miniata TaxID=46514 RepID=A0A914AFG3_PATMI|nr:clumping factor A-like [Patiria miniata]